MDFISYCSLMYGRIYWFRMKLKITAHYGDVIMGTMASQITSLTIVYSTVYSGADEKKTSKLRVTGLCAGNSPGTGHFPAQMDSSTENVSIWWRHHALINGVCHPNGNNQDHFAGNPSSFLNHRNYLENGWDNANFCIFSVNSTSVCPNCNCWTNSRMVSDSKCHEAHVLSP